MKPKNVTPNRKRAERKILIEFARQRLRDGIGSAVDATVREGNRRGLGAMKVHTLMNIMGQALESARATIAGL